MSKSSDISGLFKWFGGRPEQYQEMAHDHLTYESDELRGLVDNQTETDGLSKFAEQVGALAELAGPSQGADVWSSAGLQSLLARLSQSQPTNGSVATVTDEVAPGLGYIKVIAVVSAKGGVGKTTLAANIAVALHQAGRSVLALDLDPQNALRHHFKPVAEAAKDVTEGIAVGGQDCLTCNMQSDSGVLVLPYGDADEEQRQHFERDLATTPNWLERRLVAMRLAKNTVVVLDTPPGPSTYLRQALSVANEAVVVSLADAASYTALPQIGRLIETYTTGRVDFSGTSYVINQVDSGRQLNRDITQIMNELLGQQVLGVVRHDPAIGDALAYNRNVLEYQPLGCGSSDILECSQALVARLATASTACTQ